ncbi:MAG: DoxX family protein [Pseudonocardia sp.]
MLLRRIARPMLAAMFITGGIAALRSPQGHVQAARPVLDLVSPAVDKAVEAGSIEQRPDDEMLVQIDAAVKIVAGSMLALGRFPRLSSAALAASLIPTTLAGHRFWEESDPAEKQAQQIHFFKNVGLLGGLFIAAADTAGKPSLGWRSRRARRRAAAVASAQAAALSAATSGVRGRVRGTANQASGTAAGLAAGLAGFTPEVRARVADLQADWSKKAAKATRKAEKRGVTLQKNAAKRSAELQRSAEKRGVALQRAATERGAALQKAAERKRAELEKKVPMLIDQMSTQAARFGRDVAVRASAVGSEAAQQANGVVKDARKRVHALSR